MKATTVAALASFAAVSTAIETPACKDSIPPTSIVVPNLGFSVLQNIDINAIAEQAEEIAHPHLEAAQHKVQGVAADIAQIGNFGIYFAICYFSGTVLSTIGMSVSADQATSDAQCKLGIAAQLTTQGY